MLDIKALFSEFWALSDARRYREAIASLRKGARAGDKSCQMSLGYCFDVGRGVRRSRRWAMYWYRRAHKGGDIGATVNIGTVYRDEGRPRLAARWFRKAVAMKDGDAHLELAKLYLGPLLDERAARSELKKTIRATWVTADSQEQAARLLKELDRRQVKSRKRAR